MELRSMHRHNIALVFCLSMACSRKLIYRKIEAADSKRVIEPWNSRSIA